MSEDEAKEWVKDKANQQMVVDRFFSDYKPAETKLAFFMAGIPGAGKTEFAERFNKVVKLAPIEHDKLVEYINGYRPEEYYNYRKAGSVLVTRILNECLKRGHGFIFDGTLSHEGGYRNIEKTLKKEYRVQVIYIVQDAQLAWNLTRDRELVKKRAIEKQGFIDTCNKITKNLSAIFTRFRAQTRFAFIIFDKNGLSSMSKAISVVYETELGSAGLETDSAALIEQSLAKTYNTNELD